jgi:hypothetical protein
MIQFIRVTRMYAVTAIKDIVLSRDVESVSGHPTKCGSLSFVQFAAISRTAAPLSAIPAPGLA